MTDKAPHSPTAPQPLDAAALARLRELDPEGRAGVLQRVLTVYAASLVRAQAGLEVALHTGDAAATASLAHTLKSSSASVGALALAAACAQVEARLRGGQALAQGALADDIGWLQREVVAAGDSVRAMLPTDRRPE